MVFVTAMQITRHTDLALRLLMYLAVRPERSTVREASEVLRVSRNHLVKVAASLGELGHIELVRGRGGGIQLARRPDDITVGQVFRELENCVLVECFDERRDSCVFSGSCVLSGVLNDAFRAFCDELDRRTLGDLVRQRRTLASALDFDT